MLGAARNETNLTDIVADFLVHAEETPVPGRDAHHWRACARKLLTVLIAMTRTGTAYRDAPT
jgi:hypothetical protein